jgi:hypothetical protein
MSAAREAPAAWAARPWAARLLRCTLTLLPLVASVAFVWLLSRWLPAPSGSALRYAVWWLALSALGSVVLLIADRAARRLLPLAALLRLSLVFPDAAPSRFRAALESGKVRRLEDRLRLMKEAREAGTAHESAQRLLALVAALSEHDKLTRGHSERVRAYSVMIGEERKLDKRELDLLNWAALLHDVGKLAVNGDILRKPGRPTDAEWEQLRRHPELGEGLVGPMRPWLGEWADAVGYHHERWDGKGYPHALAGEDIPLPGRIVAIADVFDVITSARSYKEAGSAEAGRQEIARCAGDQFDPRLVRAFLSVSLGRMRFVMGPLSWLAHTPVLGRLPLAPAVGTVWSAVGVVIAAAGIAGSVHEQRPQPDKLPIAALQAQETPAPAKEVVVRPGQARGAERRELADAGSLSNGPADGLPVGGNGDGPGGSSGDTSGGGAGGGRGEGGRDNGGDGSGRDEGGDGGDGDGDGDNNSLKDPPTPPLSGMIVNRPPSFTRGTDQMVLEDGGAKTVGAWASAISPGPGAAESTQSVTFSVSDDNPALFAAAPAVSPAGTLTYTPAPNASGSATVTVSAVDDGGTANGGHDTSAPQTFTIAVAALNDAPSFSAGPSQSLSEDAGAQSLPGWATGVSPGPADESGQNVTFDVTNDSPGLFSAQPQIAPNGTLTYTPLPQASGTATVTVRLTDDGGTALGGSDTSAAQTFTISVAAVNDAPSFTGGANQLVLIDSGPQTVAGWATGMSAGPADESGQNVTFDVSSDNPGLFSAQPQIAPNGTLTYTSANGATGVATVTVRAVDDGGTANGGSDTSAPQTLTITVSEVNDPPSFSEGASQSILEDAGAQSVAGWATAISPGPASEAAQNVSFTVSNDNPALFSAQPQVAPNGTLSYTAAANASGTATVTVRAVDDGGTAFGGNDTSAPQTFGITVTDVNDPPSFTVGGDQTIILGLGAQTVPGWASAILAGPPAESGQSVTFGVVASNPGLFSVQPAVAPDGTLTYSPAFLALGSSTITETATDNGGTANGGNDTSTPRSATITIIVG